MMPSSCMHFISIFPFTPCDWITSHLCIYRSKKKNLFLYLSLFLFPNLFYNSTIERYWELFDKIRQIRTDWLSLGSIGICRKVSLVQVSPCWRHLAATLKETNFQGKVKFYRFVGAWFCVISYVPTKKKMTLLP